MDPDLELCGRPNGGAGLELDAGSAGSKRRAEQCQLEWFYCSRGERERHRIQWRAQRQQPYAGGVLPEWQHVSID